MYYSVSKDGIVKKAVVLSDLPKNDAILCYLHRIDETIIEYKTQYGNSYYWYRYEFVDIMGNPVNFKIGTCETSFVAHDEGSYYLKSRIFTIRDQYGREGDFRLSGSQSDMGYEHIDKIATKLVPFMMKLSSYGGWDALIFHLYPDMPQVKRVILDSPDC